MIKIVLSFLICSNLFAQSDVTVVKRNQKSVPLGLTLSCASTLIPVTYGIYAAEELKKNNGPAIAFGGIIVGPSFGLIYSGEYLKAGRGVLIRAGATYLLYQAGSDFDVFSNDNSGAIALAGIATAVGVGSAIMDFILVPKSIRQYNEKHKSAFIPIIDPTRKLVGLNITINY